jgi:hypothetical protein
VAGAGDFAAPRHRPRVNDSRPLLTSSVNANRQPPEPTVASSSVAFPHTNVSVAEAAPPAGQLACGAGVWKRHGGAETTRRVGSVQVSPVHSRAPAGGHAAHAHTPLRPLTSAPPPAYLCDTSREPDAHVASAAVVQPPYEPSDAAGVTSVSLTPTHGETA